MRRVNEFLEDITGSFSAKRAAFLVLLLSFFIITFVVLIHRLPPDLQAYASSTQEKICDLMKWIGGFIASEHLSSRLNKPEGESHE